MCSFIWSELLRAASKCSVRKGDLLTEPRNSGSSCPCPVWEWLVALTPSWEPGPHPPRFTWRNGLMSSESSMCLQPALHLFPRSSPFLRGQQKARASHLAWSKSTCSALVVNLHLPSHGTVAFQERVIELNMRWNALFQAVLTYASHLPGQAQKETIKWLHPFRNFNCGLEVIHSSWLKNGFQPAPKNLKK